MSTTDLIFYTDNSLPEEFALFVRYKLLEAAQGKRIISVSQKPILFGDNICVGDIGRSHRSMYIQLLAGGEASNADYIALAEHDCLFTPEHFNWTPPTNDAFYYNVNHFFVQGDPSHHAYGEYSYFRRKVLSQLICARPIFLEAVRDKIWMIEHGYMIRKGMGGACEFGTKMPNDAFVRILPCEPGVCDGRKEYLDSLAEFKDLGKETNRWKAIAFRTELPNIDIRHGGNFSGGRRSKDKRCYELPYWGKWSDVCPLH